MTQEKKQVLFMWRSPLHSMSDPDRGHPYDILDVSKTDLETPLEISVSRIQENLKFQCLTKTINFEDNFKSINKI